LRAPDERPDDREVVERLATVPDFFVEEVRLDAAAARLAGCLAVLRDLEAVLFEAVLLAAPRVLPRAAVFLAPERAEVFVPPRAVVERAEVERDDVERALLERVEAARVAGFLAVDFVVDFEDDLAAVFFAADFAGVLRAVDFADDFADDLAAVLRVVLLAAVLRAEDFAADWVVDFAAVFVPAFLAAPVFEPLLAALERDEVPVDFADDLRAVDVPDLAEDLVPFAALDEPPRELLFFALVLVAPVSPVNNCVSGLDLRSIGIAASFKGLRVQPSRFEGNVVIPMRFRISESVVSRTGIFSVDMLVGCTLFTCSARSLNNPHMATRRGDACASC
jgi:hypothetical protein